jgi:deoxyadenosine/deoxycytidine kinase
MHQHLFISIMGSMGSGKTTVATLLARKLKCHVATEQYEDNPFLPRFYDDMKRWGLTYQIQFLLTMVRQLEEIKKKLRKTSVIQDSSAIQYVYSYTQAQRVYENIDEEEWQLYLKLYKTLNSTLPTPDLIIYLDATVATLESRILHRGRSYEHAIPRDYLELLSYLNNQWLKMNETIPVVRIDTNKLNLVTDATAQEYVATLVRNSLSASHPTPVFA